MINGYHFVHLIRRSEQEAPQIYLRGVILGSLAPGAWLCRFDMGPRTHVRVCLPEELTLWSLFASAAALDEFVATFGCSPKSDGLALLGSTEDEFTGMPSLPGETSTTPDSEPKPN